MSNAAKLTQPLKWHGGKRYLAEWIIGLMPPHVHYPPAGNRGERRRDGHIHR